MLKGVPKIISPDLMLALMEMGHGDEIVLADANFPSETCGQRVIRCDGHPMPELLDAILQFLPLDSFVPAPVALMDAPDYVPEIWAVYEEIVKKHEEESNKFEYIERFEFYDRSKEAFAVVATGEEALYGNIILKKGVIKSTNNV